MFIDIYIYMCIFVYKYMYMRPFWYAAFRFQLTASPRKGRRRESRKSAIMELPEPPKGSKILDQHPEIESIGNIGSIILGILEVQVGPQNHGQHDF